MSIFSRRLPADTEVNALSRAIDALRGSATAFVDLTESNPTRAGIALIKTFLEKSEPQLKPLSVDDQIDNSFVRGLEQSGFFNALYPAK